MANKRTGLIIESYGDVIPELKEADLPELKEGQLLVEVHGSTINPSDRLSIAGVYFPAPLPRVVGIQGAGKVIKANGADVQSWVGKRVSFIGEHGTWANYAVTTPHKAFEITEDVPLHSAASGIVNPLTVIGFIENYKSLKGYEKGKKGIIHTAAASALGRMLNKICISQGIPLLNIVRRQEHADLLKKEGATHILVTSQGWVEKYQALIKEHQFNTLYDALGGGETTQALITNLLPLSHVFIYGGLEAKPLILKNPFVLFTGISITGFLLFNWYATVSKEVDGAIRAKYSDYLKKDLSTNLLKEYKFADIKAALEEGLKGASIGKILLTP